MSNIATNILVTPLAVLFYGSGLLLWPTRRWLRRNSRVRGRSLGFVCLAQVFAYCTTIVFAVTHPRTLEHFYYWFAILMLENIVFTVIGAVAWSRDAYYESTLENNKIT